MITNNNFVRKSLLFAAISVGMFSLFGCTLGVGTNGESITVYSERHYDTDQILFDNFEDETGIRIDVVDGDADFLINRMQNEGEGTPADVLIIADAGRLHRAQEAGVLRPSESQVLNENIPARYREAEGHWYGLTMRARVLVFDPERVDRSELSTYEALTDEEWEGRIVTRTSANIYNQSLMASFIEIVGEEEALALAEGLAANFARKPSGNDRDQAKYVAAGGADVAIMNTYYMGRMLHSSDPYEREVGESLEVFFPNQETTGTHVNVSGAGVAKHSDNPEDALRFIEFLSGEESQASFANANFEYPLNRNVDKHELLESWGDFKPQEIRLDVLGKHSVRAAELLDEAGWE